jgi:predicted ATPase
MPFVETPLVCPTLHGREPQLAHLGQLVDQLVGGHGGSVVVTGEAGVGKTRLVGEARWLA